MSRVPGRAAWLLVLVACGRDPDTIAICSKNFTESILLGEIVAQQIERAGHPVDRRFNLGGTFVCHSALHAGQIDLYVEYTGTAYAAVLQLPVERDSRRVRRMVDSVYRARWGVEWGAPLGFENTFAVLVRGDDARRLGLTTISDAIGAARSWRPGLGYEFVERADGYRGLLAAYGLTFAAAPAEMDLGLTYRALADGRVDVIVGNSTDGLIDALDLVQLEDDRRYFPPYEAVPIVRSETLARHPDVRAALAALGGRIDAASMRRMNFQVDGAKRAVADVAREFLAGVPDAVR
ncbi:MAG TPA: glycine betaine ABC transporter substrate-binding protein [Gemmatimonadales bacterium]